MRVALCVGLLGCLISVSIAPAQEAPDPRAARTAYGLVRPPLNFWDLCKITREDGNLKAEIKIPAGDEHLGDLDYGSVSLKHSMLAGKVPTEVFMFRVPAPVPANGPFAWVELKITGTQMVFRGHGGPGSGVALFTLTQMPVASGPASVRVVVDARLGRLMFPNVEPVHHVWQDDDLASSIKNHPEMTSQCLLPLLKDLHLENLLLKPTEWHLVQLFPDVFKPDDATRAAVRSLVEKLDSDSPDDRQTASVKLKEMGPVAASILAAIDPESLSQEQTARITVLCKGRLTERQISDLSTNTDFLLDCLDDPRLAVRAAALEKLKRAIGHDVIFDLNLDSNKRSQAIEALRRQLKAATPG